MSLRNVLFHVIIFLVMLFSGFSLVQKGGNKLYEWLLWFFILFCVDVILIKPTRNIKQIGVTLIWIIITLPITFLASIILSDKLIFWMTIKFGHDYETWTLDYNYGFPVRAICWAIFGILNSLFCYLFSLLRRNFTSANDRLEKLK